MFDQKQFISQPEHRGIHDSHTSAKGSPADPENLLTSPQISVPFRLIGDFVVEVENAAEYLQEPDLNSNERRLFLAIINTPEALNCIGRLAVVSALTEDSERHFKKKFMGPETEDILNSVLPHLPVDLQEYWWTLQQEKCGCAEFHLDRIFQQFNTSLRNTQILDASTGESIPLWVNSKIQPPL